MDTIIAENLSFSYSGYPVLQNASFQVQAGEFIAVIGPNGGGKTTLLYLIMAFLKPKSGSLKIFGRSPKEAGPMMGWVPQNFHYDRHFPISVLEVVLMSRLSKTNFLGNYSKEDKVLALQALEQVGLKGFEKTPFSELSGGQAQRVLIARALASNPHLLLLDEATANVDKEAQAEIHKILNHLKGKITILMVTHDLNAIFDSVDRVLCVQTQVTPLSKEEVCQHFALGLYHPPLKTLKRDP